MGVKTGAGTKAGKGAGAEAGKGAGTGIKTGMQIQKGIRNSRPSSHHITAKTIDLERKNWEAFDLPRETLKWTCYLHQIKPAFFL